MVLLFVFSFRDPGGRGFFKLPVGWPTKPYCLDVLNFIKTHLGGRLELNLGLIWNHILSRYTCVHLCLYIYIYIYLSKDMYVYIYIHTYILIYTCMSYPPLPPRSTELALQGPIAGSIWGALGIMACHTCNPKSQQT